MCQMLLSINPEYVKKIIDGTKEYEFRKNRCKRTVDKILIYETSPVCRVVAEAEIEDIIEGKPKEVWNIAKQKAGVKKSFFDTYYKGKNNAVAYKLKNVNKLDTPLHLSELGIKCAPQSYVYIESVLN